MFRPKSERQLYLQHSLLTEIDFNSLRSIQTGFFHDLRDIVRFRFRELRQVLMIGAAIALILGDRLLLRRW